MQIKCAEFIGSFIKNASLPRSGLPEIAFLGRSNVGKSSLINTLLGKKNLAKTSGTPGKTQSINFYVINESFYFVDLPGYGYAKVSKDIKKTWQSIIENYLKNRETLILGILIIDSRHLPFESDLLMREWLEFYNLPYIIVLTKIDRSKTSQIIACENALRLAINGRKIIRFSAKTKLGKEPLWHIIDTYLNKNNKVF